MIIRNKITDYVMVELTPTGKKILKQYEKKVTVKTMRLRDGALCLELWELMAIFGEELRHNGKKSKIFVNNTINFIDLYASSKPKPPKGGKNV